MITPPTARKTKKSQRTPQASKAPKHMTYEGSGVSYKDLDPVKRYFMQTAARTAINIADTGYSELSSSRGESFYALRREKRYDIMTIEGLGTRNKVAELAAEFTGNPKHYYAMGYSNVLVNVNDLLTSGGRALTFLLHIATGSAAWMKNGRFMKAFADGTKKACDDARCTWGCGETSSLRDLVERPTAVLGGAAFGTVEPLSQLVRSSNIRAGDAIILLGSSGIHDNGITLTRDLPALLPQGYSTKMPGGQKFFEALLEPTVSYAKLIYELVEIGIPLHYIINITGHGWRKLMRATEEFTYRIHRLLPIHPIFHFIQKWGNIVDKEMWGNYNMGAGYALIVPRKFAERVVAITHRLGYKAIIGGFVEKGPKQVLIEPVGVEFDELGVR